MLTAIDLTHRQATRVLEQALRARARVQLEPRMRDQTLCGTLTGREEGLLRVQLDDQRLGFPLLALVGAFWDVSTVLSGQLYRFCSCVVAVISDVAPPALLLSVPEVIQVANRRRFARKTLSEQVPVQVRPELAEPLTGSLREIGPGGLNCRLPRDADAILLIDDRVVLSFVLPPGTECFELPALVCFKCAVRDGEHVDVGFEFASCPSGQPAAAALERLRALLAQDLTGQNNPDTSA
jgi:hypothetical protein